jgi:hypothetical protein
VLELVKEVGLLVEDDDVRFRDEIQEDCFFLLDVFDEDGLFFFEVVAVEKVDVVGPEADFDGLEGISDDKSDDISLFLEGVGVLVGDLLFDILHNADNVHHLALDPLILMLPPVVLLLIL